MTQTAPILVVGGGMAGSLLALVLGRQGRAVTVFDPRREPVPVFRNEKLGHEQIALLEKFGALDCFAEACWPAASDPDAYPQGERPALYDCGAPHAEWLKAVRRAWPAHVRFVETSVESAEPSAVAPAVVTREGERVEGSLLALATGRLPTLCHSLGLKRRVFSANHSVCLGFSVAMDVRPTARIFPSAFGTGLGYVSVFPMPGEVRVNVFSYRSLTDAWTRRMSTDPLSALAELAPDAARALTGARVVRRCEARGTDLYETLGYDRLPGVVLLGDAFHAPCPASGTGMLRILNDIDVLTADCIPAWTRSPDARPARTAQFYRHARKRRIDRISLHKSRTGRANALETSLVWRARRSARRLLAARR